MDTVDRLLVGEAVNDRSGEDIEVAVEEVEFIFLTVDVFPVPPLRLVGMPDNRLREGGVNSTLSVTSKVLLAVNRWPILAKDNGSLFIKKYFKS